MEPEAAVSALESGHVRRPFGVPLEGAEDGAIDPRYPALTVLKQSLAARDSKELVDLTCEVEETFATVPPLLGPAGPMGPEQLQLAWEAMQNKSADHMGQPIGWCDELCKDYYCDFVYARNWNTLVEKVKSQFPL